MSSSPAWASRRRRIGWSLAVIGGAASVTGIGLRATGTALGFDPRVVTGLGILLLGLAVASLLRGGVGSRGGDAVRRLGVEERDERNVSIRRLAGNRAFVVSVSLTYALLMYVSLSSNGQVPELSADALWYALAASFVCPMLVYVGSIVHAQHVL